MTENLPIGSVVRRRLDGWLGMLTWHWGIHVGNDQIVHFNGFTKKERAAIIRIDSWDTFAAGRAVMLHRRPDSLEHGLATARKAREIQALIDNPFNNAYQFLFNNCQDFCRHCVNP